MSLLAAAFNSERFEQMELAPMTWRRLPGGNEPLLRATKAGGVAFAVVGHGRAGRRSWRCTRKSDQLLVVCCCHGNRPQRRCSSGITHSLRHTSSPLPVRPTGPGITMITSWIRSLRLKRLLQCLIFCLWSYHTASPHLSQSNNRTASSVYFGLDKNRPFLIT